MRACTCMHVHGYKRARARVLQRVHACMRICMYVCMCQNDPPPRKYICYPKSVAEKNQASAAFLFLFLNFHHHISHRTPVCVTTIDFKAMGLLQFQKESKK